MRHALTYRFSLSLVLVSCGPVAPPEQDASTGAAETSDTGAPPTTAPSPTTGPSTITDPTTSGDPTPPGTVGTSSDPATSTADSGSTPGTTSDGPCGFICTGGDESDGCGAVAEADELRLTLCDVFVQDCPEGDKCAPAARCPGDTWNTTKCVPVTGDGAPGEPCIAPGDTLDGVDDCKKGAMCSHVDPRTHQGTCVELCSGTQADPVCSNEAELDCIIHNDGVLPLCMPACDPLVQGCENDELCLPIGDAFVCVIDGSGEEGQLFDPCEFTNACDEGLLCAAPTAALECDVNASGCCVPFCDLSDVDATCPGDEQSCVSFFEEGVMPPPEHADVGVCMTAP